MSWDSSGWRDASAEYHAARSNADERLKKLNGGDFVDVAFSDIALASEFADQNAKLLRFVPLMGKWFVWDGKRWEMDVRLTAREQAKATCRSEAQKCNKAKAAKLIASARTVSSVERLGQCDPRLIAVADQWDGDPWLLNTPGGTIDLRTGNMRPHNPDDGITKITGVGRPRVSGYGKPKD